VENGKLSLKILFFERAKRIEKLTSSRLLPLSGLRSNNNIIRGFTLIELIFVITIIAVLTSVGIASYVSYDHSQTLQNATLDVVTMLNVAKSRASTQYVPPSILQCKAPPAGAGEPLGGYKVVITASSDSSSNPNPNTYELKVICGPNDGSNEYTVGSSHSLPRNFKFTGNAEYTFLLINGGVVTTGPVTVSGYSNTISKTIGVDGSGNISHN
jgi:prepilin-type N-terminal cleavage/methylation domain-containing protein